MSEAKVYKVGDVVMCRVRSKRRIIWDEPYRNNNLLESRPFKIIGPLKTDTYTVLVEDNSLASWMIDDGKITQGEISSSFRGQRGYFVYAEAIGGIAPQNKICKQCQQYNKDLNDKLENIDTMNDNVMDDDYVINAIDTVDSLIT